MTKKPGEKLYNGERYNYYPFLYLIMLATALAVLIFRGVPNESVYQTRSGASYHLQQIAQERVFDAPEAPAGVKRQYIIRPEFTDGPENCLMFYQVHHAVHVYICDKLVYSFEPDPMLATPTVGSSWIVLPLKEADEGKDIRVIMTPLYDEVINRKTEFYVGSSYELFKNTVIKDSINLIASFLAIVVGLVFVIMSMVMFVMYRRANRILYLGCFSGFMGTWKITDMQSATLIFPISPALLSSVSIIMLPLAVSSFLFFMQMEIGKMKYKFLNVACILSILITIFALLFHISGVCALRESLVVIHILIILAVISSMHATIAELVRDRNNKNTLITMICFGVCITVALVDLADYYIYGWANNVSILLLAFIVYVTIIGIGVFSELRRASATDYITELYNRSRCNELIASEAKLDADTCLIMFDLNGLKNVNDTLGHEYGDRLIKEFSNLMQQKLPRYSFLGRYGGDEFIAVIQDCGEETVHKLIADFDAAVQHYNVINPELTISYSVGWAISDSDSKNVMKMLFDEADNKMYLAKKEYYEKHDRRRRN